MTTSEPSGGDPLAAFEAELAELRAKAERMQESLREATATVRSKDGAATITVGPGGSVTNLEFGPRAYQRPPAALAALVLELMASAQKQVGAQVAEAFGGLVGENSAAMEVLQEFLPEDDDEPDDDDGVLDVAEDPAPPPPPPLSPPQPQPRRRARPPSEDDEDFTDPW
ncbi:YbaB/EbfC family nucleoid-associated protein [Amycolatopsis sp.]|uniref:YbaB/EbfC family nucleoid-associated protein n=1 Tax=Amycolatopsis sp. TaxID=37632 RepID=UPI002C55C5DF|nr:YbaB/EbfC family nucleoid-associated protein [Amycolatopsis sp.]HVV13644.1 YbaB/EbfC family nucleoid-associated protein [Amycolatopsis sp.]